MPTDRQHLKAALAISERGIVPASSDDPVLNRLHEIARLAAAFARGRETGAAPLEQWNHLAVGELLGQGGFGSVYRAFDPVLQREVALKLAPAGAPGEDQAFIEEARRLARVRHANVLAVHGADVAAGHVGMWADLVPGRTLETLVSADQRLSQAQLLVLAAQLAAALRAVHAAELVHGDVKASNVMWDDAEQATLMDFGAAHRLRQGTVRFGSPMSMAPELFEHPSGTPASDIYALGVLLYRLAVGRYPHDGKDRPALIQNKKDQSPDPQPLRPLSPPLRRLILNMLCADPHQRPSTMAVLAAVDRIRTAPARRARKVVVACVLLGLATALTAVSIAFVETRRAQREASAALERADAVNAVLTDLLSAARPTRAGETTSLADALILFEPRLEQALISQPQARADLFRTVGKTFLQLHEPDKARPYLEESARLAPIGSAEDLAGAIGTQNLLAKADLAQGDPQAAIERAGGALAVASQRLPAHQEMQLQLLLTLSEAHEYSGDMGQALAWAVDAQALAETTVWQNPSRRVLALRRLAKVHLTRRDPTAAEPWARQAVATADQFVGARNTITLQARNVLAQLLMETGRPQEAIAEARTALSVVEGWLGADHRETLIHKNVIGIGLNELGQYQAAEEILSQVYLRLSESPGPGAMDTLAVLQNLANARRYQHKFAQAEADYRVLLKQAERSLGASHFLTHITRNNLAECLLAAGRNEEARTLADEAVARNSELFGDQHLFTQHALGVSAAARARLGDAKAAVPVLQEIVPALAAMTGAHSPTTIQSQTYLAEALLTAGDAEKAGTAIAEARRRASEALKAEHELFGAIERVELALQGSREQLR